MKSAERCLELENGIELYKEYGRCINEFMRLIKYIMKESLFKNAKKFHELRGLYDYRSTDTQSLLIPKRCFVTENLGTDLMELKFDETAFNELGKEPKMSQIVSDIITNCFIF